MKGIPKLLGFKENKKDTVPLELRGIFHERYPSLFLIYAEIYVISYLIKKA